MRVTFLGGAGTVTGSRFFIETGTARVLVDCGLFQGYKWLRRRNWQPFPIDVSEIDAIVLTHAHLDHSGYLPVLYKAGYRGPVYTHPATAALCGVLLPDSGHIMEEDARYLTKHRASRHDHPEPLYDRATAEASQALFKPLEFGEPLTIGDAVIRLQPAGHILGAASVMIEAGGKRIGISGDVGRPDDVLMHPPARLPDLDVLLLESTYGNRRHDRTDPGEQLASLVRASARKGGVLLIPAFAVGRTQTVQHLLASLMAADAIPRLPVYLDSPMAIDVSDIYCEFAAQHRLSAEDCRQMCHLATYTRSVAESREIAAQKYPHIVIAGSGMATGGRILHHFKRLLSNPLTTVLFTGYQAGGTRGAKMIDGADAVKIHGNWVPVKAEVTVLHGLSGHADHVDLVDWLTASGLGNSCTVHLVHGDADALEAQRDHLRRHTSFDVDIAGFHDVLQL